MVIIIKHCQCLISLIELENINDLTDNCQYWIGEIYYATRDFRNAIDAFDKYLGMKKIIKIHMLSINLVFVI